MTAEDRARLNRRAAELAGWTLETDTTGRAWWVPPLWGAGSWLREAPDFVGSPALWWPLVEAVLLQGYDWKGPLYDDRTPLCWYVTARGELITGESPGECAVKGALAVAAALGLKG